MKRLFTIFTTLFTLVTVAQNGTIRGIAYDKENGESLIGAAILVEGTAKGVPTDFDGAYSIEIAPGTYRLKASYISYDEIIISEIVVKPGKITVVDFYLAPSSQQLAEVVITAKAQRNTESAVTIMQRNSLSVMDGISSQQIKRAGDNDAAGAMKRITGVSVEGGKYVSVRGLGDRYSKTLLNGADIPSLDPDKNSVQLDLFPTNLIDNMLVFKTFTPNLPGDFTGGLINLGTKDFPEKFTFQFSGSFGFNDQSTLNKNFLTYQGGSTDWLAVDDGTRNAPDRASELPDNLATFLANDKNRDIVKSFNKTMSPVTKAPGINQRYAISVGDQKLIGKMPFGIIGSLTYAYNTSFYENGTVGRWESPNPNQLQAKRLLNDNNATESVLWGAMINSNLKINANNKVGLTLLHNQSSDKSARTLAGAWDEYQAIPNNDQFYSQSLNWIQRSISTAQLKGEHNLPNASNLKVDWIASYTLAKQYQPDFRLFAYDIEGYGTDNPITQISQQAYQPPTRFFRDMNENNIDLKLNFELPFSNWTSTKGAFKFGGAYLNKDRNFEELQYDYLDQNGSFSGSVPDFIADANIVESYQDQGFWMRNNRQLSNTYNGLQSISAAYAMADLPVSEKLKAIFGVRFERTDISVISLNANDQEGKVVANDFLPSLNFIYTLNEKQNLRFGYSRTLARPTFRELAPFASYLFAGDYVMVGNPELTRTLIDNIDLRWEIYPNQGDLISASLFYKKFDNPIERSIDPRAQNTQISFVNVPSATVYGVEFEIKKELAFISNEKNKFRTGVNASYIFAQTQIDQAEYEARLEIDPNASSTRPMFGQSPWIANAFFSYFNLPLNLSATASFNMWGKRLSIVSRGRVPDVYEQSRPSLDVVLEKGLGERFSLGFKAQNLINPDNYKTYDFNGNSYDFERFALGRTYSISLKYAL